MACLSDAGLLTSSLGLEGTRVTKSKTGALSYVHGTRSPRFGVGTGGGAVALMVELMASGITLPESAPLSSWQCCESLAVRASPTSIA